ncbi:KpsF/GutQ family sugar-phosphate isomerase [Roseicyclus sp. F158]|uniref:KpsF/GutQ family sugar-phosphate isomerase n=1 Tax=Tropicimonas omnivorans TaxID=3075590 RepID=A0ABU3DCV4_9RHOB|nr:KpsF/GutQ family sugar-phosphate isomerase [Roseicyclus sp. F158]MDT0681549.1 KpsF/GutQ family sugar-phosphate isomerase [Roseicyclus sp. F158]
MTKDDAQNKAAVTAGDDALIETGRRVVETESAALTALSGALGASFAETIRTILAATGRVIVSGMGKSGHIGRKIAATLASTGTPAHYVHPGEASHGDLGMIKEGDVALLLSNSGETTELADMIAYTRRFGIPLISVSSVPGSTLMTRSDIALVLPEAAEACGRGIVPTTTTTMMLALGDALAVALMEQRAFTPERFRDFHPGGKLGRRLSKVEDLMHGRDQLPLVAEHTAMGEVLIVMSQKAFGVAGVTDGGGCLSGIVTDGDLRRHMGGLLELNAGQVMTPGPRTIRPEALAEEALAEMQRRRITCLFVVDGEMPSSPLGLLHIHDCLRAGLI